MTINNDLPTLSRAQWKEAEAKLRAAGFLTAGLRTVFGPCPPEPRPVTFRQVNVGGYSVRLETFPFRADGVQAGVLEIKAKRTVTRDRLGTGMSAADMRALAAALVTSADFAEGRS